MAEQPTDVNDSPETVPAAAPPVMEEAPSDPHLPAYPGPASVSPDNQAIAWFLRDLTGTVRLWTQSLSGGEPVQIHSRLTGMDDTDEPQWSPDGKSIAISAAHPVDGRPAIWVIDLQSSQSHLLIEHDARDTQPRWAPDGATIAFISRRDGRAALTVAPADGSGPAYQLSQPLHGQMDHDPTWAPDGSRIAFSRRTVENEQVGDHIWCVNIGTGELKQVTKKLANRTNLRWSPERPIILHTADDQDWLNVSVINVDNSANWNIASEAGDKLGGQYSKDGGRVIYTRLREGVIRLCERAASSASAELLDPGDGVVLWAKWIHEHPYEDPESGQERTRERRVVYCHVPAIGGYSVYVQEPKADAPRTKLATPTGWATTRPLTVPVFREFEANGRKLGGLLYQPAELEGRLPAVLLLGDRIDRPVAAHPDLVAQALAATGLVVFVPSLTGQPGYGKKVQNALAELTDTEAEVLELQTIVGIVREWDGIDGRKVAIAGSGQGGALALLLAGSRPGSVEAVAAIDPIGAWDHEYDQADAGLRAWLERNYGIPGLQRGRYALRTPVTFAGVIASPVLVVSTPSASEQRVEQADDLAGLMTDLGVSVERVTVGEGPWDAGDRIASFLREAFTAVPDVPEEDDVSSETEDDGEPAESADEI